jgi:hypothetical protein
MRIRSLNALVLIAATALGLSAADNSLGTWKRNTEKSKYNPTPPNPIKSQTMVREAADGGVKVTSKGQRMDGTPLDITYTIKYDGKPVAVTGTGSQFDTISMRQIDANTFTSETKKSGGKYHTTGRTVISNDGKTMTITSTGTDADGKPISFTIVYDKQ